MTKKSTNKIQTITKKGEYTLIHIHNDHSDLFLSIYSGSGARSHIILYPIDFIRKKG